MAQTRIALVTGANQGIGLQVANELATLRDHFYRLHHHGKSAWEHVEMGR